MIDDHPLLVGAEVQSIPARRWVDLVAFLKGNLKVAHLYRARFLLGAAHPRAWQPTNTVSPNPYVLA